MIEVGGVHTNLTLRTIDALPKNGGADVAEVSMNFDDFIDMVNPLQHIPVVSAVYRAVSGENINPVSRVAGDALYGGVLGLASAGLSAMGAIGDEVFAANNDGKSASGTLVAALFGNEKDNNVQVAENSAPAAPTTATAATETTPVAAVETALAQEPVVAAAENIPAETTQAAAQTAAPAEDKLMTLASAVSAPAASMTPASGKLPFGGVIDLSAITTVSQNQNMPAATDGRRELFQAQRTMRNNRFAVASAAAPAAPAIDTSKATPETQTAMQKLLDELQASKAISQYQNAAQNMPLAGENVDIVN